MENDKWTSNENDKMKGRVAIREFYVSYSLNSLKGGYIGDSIGHYYKGYYGGY